MSFASSNIDRKASPSLASILQRPDVWKIGQVAGRARTSLPTGFDALNTALPDRGWEQGAMTELMTDAQGIGELSVLLPALRQVTNAGSHVVLINPPFVPLPMTFESHGVELSRLVIVRAQGADLLWAIEQAAKHNTGGVVIGWLNQSGKLVTEQALRRLQHAAHQGDATLFVYRSTSARLNASPAPTRIVITADNGSTQLSIIKRRAAMMADPIVLELYPSHWIIRMQQLASETGANNRSASAPYKSTHTSSVATTRSNTVTIESAIAARRSILPLISEHARPVSGLKSPDVHHAHSR